MSSNILSVTYEGGCFFRDFDESVWCTEQNLYAKMVDLNEHFREDTIKFIGGFDISGPSKNSSNNLSMACLSVFDYKTQKQIAEFFLTCTIEVPYKAGFLAYKEVPAFLELLKHVKKNHKSFVPDIMLIDGNGIWHTRSCGSASHISVLSGIPCIGVSKSYLQIDGLPSKEEIEKKILEKNLNVGETYRIKREGSNDDFGEIYMATESIKKCLYISVGSGLVLDLAVKIVKKFMIYRNNELVRNADIKSRQHKMMNTQ